MGGKEKQDPSSLSLPFHLTKKRHHLTTSPRTFLLPPPFLHPFSPTRRRPLPLCVTFRERKCRGRGGCQHDVVLGPNQLRELSRRWGKSDTPLRPFAHVWSPKQQVSLSKTGWEPLSPAHPHPPLPCCKRCGIRWQKKEEERTGKKVMSVQHAFPLSIPQGKGKRRGHCNINAGLPSRPVMPRYRQGSVRAEVGIRRN